MLYNKLLMLDENCAKIKICQIDGRKQFTFVMHQNIIFISKQFSVQRSWVFSTKSNFLILLSHSGKILKPTICAECEDVVWIILELKCSASVCRRLNVCRAIWRKTKIFPTRLFHQTKFIFEISKVYDIVM